MDEITVSAGSENLTKVINFISKILEEKECPFKTRVQIEIAVEEIFVNIVKYAYSDGGTVNISCEILADLDQAVICFKDHGIPYNPLQREEPDVGIPADERPVGGLGILLVRKMMSEVLYEYKDNQNILTLKKRLYLRR